MNLKYVIIGVVSIIIFIILFRTLREALNSPIDIVYTWVDSEDADRDKYIYGLEVDDKNLEHSRYDNTEELKYSIRSVFKYCQPWMGTVYIVVKDGQRPPFIDFENKRVVLVNHSEIMPSGALPTFNSNAIELCLHKIKNLSKTYVYFNDDLFLSERFSPLVGDKISLNMEKKKTENTKAEKAEPGQPYNFDKMYANTMYYAKTLLDADINIKFLHTPSVCYKQWEKEMEQILMTDGLWDQTVTAKFRQNTDIITNNSFRTFFYMKKKDKISISKWKDSYNELRDAKTCHITVSPFFSVNEVKKPCSAEFVRQMEALYPEPSPIERAL